MYFYGILFYIIMISHIKLYMYFYGILFYIIMISTIKIYMYFYGILFYIIMISHIKSMEFFSISSTKASDHHWQTMAQFLPVRILKSFRCVCIAVSITELDNEIYDTKHALLSTFVWYPYHINTGPRGRALHWTSPRGDACLIRWEHG